MQRIVNIAIVLGLFCVSFLFFLYMTFPFVVLKEAVVDRLNNQFPDMTFRIGELTIYPVGVGAENFAVEVPGTGELKLGSVNVGLSLLAFLTGSVGIHADIQDTKKGDLRLEGYVPLTNIISQQFIPKSVALTAKNFSIDNPAEFGLGMAASGKGTNPMVAPLLEAVGITGNLDGELDLQLNSDDPTQSKGRINLELKKAAIKLDDASLGLNDQVFKNALVAGKLNNGTLEFDKKSGFETSDLFVDLSGKIILKSQLPASIFDLNVMLQLRGDLLTNFGFLLATVAKTSEEGKVTFQIRGPMQELSFSAF